MTNLFKNKKIQIIICLGLFTLSVVFGYHLSLFTAHNHHKARLLKTCLTHEIASKLWDHGGYEPRKLTRAVIYHMVDNSLVFKKENRDPDMIAEMNFLYDLLNENLDVHFNILKVQLEFLILIPEDILTRGQKDNIIQKAANSGGVIVSNQFGRHNPLVFSYQLLETLLKNGHIDKKTGQSLIDSAKIKK